MTADCSFLGDDTGEWTAHVVRDAERSEASERASGEGRPASRDDGNDGLETEEWTVTGREAIDVVVAPNGGFVARFERE